MIEPEISAVVRQRVMRSGHIEWLDQLPGTLTQLEHDWRITIGPRLAGGSASFVARAQRRDGGDAVVKIALPECDIASEAAMLTTAAGHGYARLYEHDSARRAMLLESLGTPLQETGQSSRDTVITLCQTLSVAWRVPLPSTVRVFDKATQLAQIITGSSELANGHCSESVVHQALRYAARRSQQRDERRAVRVHGDPHAGNALAVRRSGAPCGFVFVDPDGFVADPAYDVGVILREWSTVLRGSPASYHRAERYCQLAAYETGLDEDAIWEWSFIECVSTGLHLIELGEVDTGKTFLDTAELLL